MTRSLCLGVFVAAFTVALVAATPETLARDTPIVVGDAAPSVTVSTYTGRDLDLGEALAGRTAVLVALRGYPGYQCPLCSRQATEYIGLAKQFADAGVLVVLVYPGEADGLAERANEFLADRSLPQPVLLAIDPDYEFTTAYGIRWDAPRETAYPATFVVKDGEVVWAKVSNTHGGRVKASAALAAATR